MNVSKFAAEVYSMTRRIPEGRVTTYGELAQAISCRSPRAVGQALRRNPFAPDTPCHRVVAADLTLGGFAGQRNGPEIDRKRRLLEAEGVRFENDRIVECCFVGSEFLRTAANSGSVARSGEIKKSDQYSLTRKE